jgi:hypothetical protein
VTFTFLSSRSTAHRKKSKSLKSSDGEESEFSSIISSRRRSTPILTAATSSRTLNKPQLSMRDRRANASGAYSHAVASDRLGPMIDSKASDRYESISSLFSNSPISPRVRSIEQDIEALTLSRQDNPFLCAQLERISATSGVPCDFLSASQLSLSSNHVHFNGSSAQHTPSLTTSFAAHPALHPLHPHQPPSHDHGADEPHTKLCELDDSCLSIELDELLNDGTMKQAVHDHLVRSPPPHFPRKLSQFLFPEPGSPIRSLSVKYRHAVEMRSCVSGDAIAFDSSHPSMATESTSRSRQRHQSSQPSTSVHATTLLSPMRCKSATQRDPPTMSFRRALTVSTESFDDSLH